MTVAKWQLAICLWLVVSINITLKFRLRRDESCGYLILSITRRKWINKLIGINERKEENE